MRIAYVIWGLGLGGAENLLFELSSRLTKQDDKFLVINLLGTDYFSEKLRENNIEVIDLALFHRPIFNPLNFGKLLHRSYQLFRHLKSFNPQLIHTWMYPADILGGLMGRILGRPVIWGIFSGSTSRKLYRPLFWLSMATCAKFARRVPNNIVSCSAYGRRSHIAFGYPKARILFIPLGFRSDPPVAPSTYVPQDNGLSKDSVIRIGMLGRFSPEKQHGLLISIISQLQRCDVRCHLFLAGGIGITSSNSALSKMLRDSSVEDHVSLLGQVPSLVEFFSLIDIFCLFSISEGFPTVVGEAMVAELPCLVTDVGDGALILSDSRQVADRDSKAEHFSKLKSLCVMNAEARHQIGQRNRRRVLHNFPKDRMTRRYKTLYRKTLELSTHSASSSKRGLH
jgi:glycosyltransferase involved in cell wall biosynthesis